MMTKSGLLDGSAKFKMVAMKQSRKLRASFSAIAFDTCTTTT